MRILNFSELLPLPGLYLLILTAFAPALISAQVYADTGSPDLLLLGDADNGNESPRSGSLVLPATKNMNADKSEKKCMTVCQRWGQDCMIDNSRGVRKCRRTCKEFGQECF